MIRLLALLLVASLALPVAAGKPKPAPKPTCSSFGWCKVGTISNYTGYAAIVPVDASHFRLFSNWDGGPVIGDLWKRDCTWSACSSAAKVLHIDVARDIFIRTVGCARDDRWYCVLYTGDGYPTQGGYSPSWATSDDGLAWTWEGSIGIFGRNQSSAMNLLIGSGNAYRFMFWMDLYAPVNLLLVHSDDGQAWASDQVNVWPIANETPQFVSAVRDQYGYHLFGADRYDGTTSRHIRHVFSCDGLTGWRVLESASIVGTGGSKGVQVATDGVYLHAVTDGADTHWTIPVRDWGC